jgi:hypothetical protein
MVLSAAVLFAGEVSERFGMFHCVPPQLLIVHVERGIHQHDCTHFIDIVNSCFLQDFHVCDMLPLLRGEAVLIGKTANSGVQGVDIIVERPGNVMTVSETNWFEEMPSFWRFQARRLEVGVTVVTSMGLAMMLSGIAIPEEKVWCKDQGRQEVHRCHPEFPVLLVYQQDNQVQRQAVPSWEGYLLTDKTVRYFRIYKRPPSQSYWS